MKRYIASAIVVFGFVIYAAGQNNTVSASPQATAASSGATGGEGTPSVASSGGNGTGSGLRDGTYTGDTVDAYYGNVRVSAVISGGRLADVTFLDYPQDRGRSVAINRRAMPVLISEAVQSQDANVDIVTGATATSEAFVRSLATALSRAKG